MRQQLLLCFAFLCCLALTNGSATSTWFTPTYDVYHDNSFLSENWDIIIVGAGTAGSVVANRLSVNPTVKVLVLEAGGPSQRATGSREGGTFRYKKNHSGGYELDGSWTRYDVPNLSQTLWSTAGLDPNVPRFPQWAFQGYPALAAKVLGGNMAHNGFFWYRGTPRNFDVDWGITGWSYADMLTYYKKAENVSSSRVHPGDPFHGFSGPVQITDPYPIEPDAPIFCNATVNTNPSRFKYINDINGNNYVQQEGCGYLWSSIRDGIRDSSVVAYLFNTPVIRRPNLQIRGYAQVTKVLFNSAKKATGVVFVDMHTGHSHTINARKAVILSGGTLNSAKVLLQSGIGPAADLTSVGIPVVHNNPNVGRNIRNTPTLNVLWEVANMSHPNFYNQYNEAIKYALTGEGMYSSSGFSLFHILKSTASAPFPDLAIISYPGGDGSLWGNQYSLALAETDPPFADGFVKLLNNNALSNNLYYFQNYSTPQHNYDIQVFVDGIKLIRNIMTHAPATSHFIRETVPGPSYNTDAKLAAWVRSVVGEQWHYATSAKMGNPGDPAAVVDNHCRVLGVSNLLVVDASIFPNSTHGWMEATVVAVAERASALIITDLGL